MSREEEGTTKRDVFGREELPGADEVGIDDGAGCTKGKGSRGSEWLMEVGLCIRAGGNEIFLAR
jgi:hypothetical protein